MLPMSTSPAVPSILTRLDPDPTRAVRCSVSVHAHMKACIFVGLPTRKL